MSMQSEATVDLGSVITAMSTATQWGRGSWIEATAC